MHFCNYNHQFWNVQSYPGSVLPQVTSFVLYAVGVFYSLQEFNLLDDVLPFLWKQFENYNNEPHNIQE